MTITEGKIPFLWILEKQSGSWSSFYTCISEKNRIVIRDRFAQKLKYLRSYFQIWTNLMTFLNLDNCFFGRTDIFFPCVFEINKTLQQCSFGISVILSIKMLLLILHLRRSSKYFSAVKYFLFWKSKFSNLIFSKSPLWKFFIPITGVQETPPLSFTTGSFMVNFFFSCSTL